MVNETKIVGNGSAVNEGLIYKTNLSSGSFNLVADEPFTSGGSKEGPAPGDYLCMALAACKAITLRMYVRRKDWNAGEISVSVSLLRTGDTAATVHTFQCVLSATGELSEEQKQRLLQIEKACPVSKLLVKGAEIVSSFV